MNRSGKPRQRRSGCAARRVAVGGTGVSVGGSGVSVGGTAVGAGVAVAAGPQARQQQCHCQEKNPKAFHSISLIEFILAGSIFGCHPAIPAQISTVQGASPRSCGYRFVLRVDLTRAFSSRLMCFSASFFCWSKACAIFSGMYMCRKYSRVTNSNRMARRAPAAGGVQPIQKAFAAQRGHLQ